ncbi:MAG: putative ABC transporter permease [Slackia sp.]|nr:putative ABC transporter permease [Slackia sp.]
MPKRHATHTVRKERIAKPADLTYTVQEKASRRSNGKLIATDSVRSDVHEFVEEARHEFASVAKPREGLFALNYWRLLWLFVVGAIVGLVLEVVFHAMVYGGYESRAGLVWGPFSPIYGFGAVFLTIVLNRFWHNHNVVIFTIAMIVGSALEYVTSWGMETLFGAVAWNYEGTFGSINGRTNFVFGVMWGLLGLIWVRSMLPFFKKAFEAINVETLAMKVIGVALTAFLVVDALFTLGAVGRQSERIVGIEATTPVQEFFDEHFPDEWMKERFHMTVFGRPQ